MSGDNKYVRCLLQGDHSVGKVKLGFARDPRRYQIGSISYNRDCGGKVIEVDVGRHVLLRYEEVSNLPGRAHHYHWCDVCLMCFSLVDPHSYENILKDYYAHFTTWRFDVPILVVGTKSDLVNDVDTLSRLRGEGEAPLTREDGLRLAETINAVGYVECSSLSGLGLDQVFREACKAGLDAKEPLHDNE